MKTNANVKTNANANDKGNIMRNTDKDITATICKDIDNLLHHSAITSINRVNNPDGTRASYRFASRRDGFDIVTECGAKAYLDATLNLLRGAFDGTAYEMESLTYEIHKTAKNRSLRIIAIPAHLDSKGIYMSANTTASIDIHKLATNYIKRWNRLYENAAEKGSAAAIAAAEKAKKLKKIDRQATEYRKALETHFSPEKAEKYANEFRDKLVAQMNRAA